MKKTLKKIFDFSASITFTLIVLAAISLFMALPLGGEKLQEYFKNLPLLQSITSVDFYQSKTFIVLLALFCFNLLTCSIKHFQRTLHLLKGVSQVPTDTLLSSLPIAEQIVISDDGLLKKKLANIMARYFKKPRFLQGSSSPYYFYAERGRFTHFGFYIAHLSMLTLVLGIIVSTSGYCYYVDIAKGQRIDPLRIVDSMGKIHKLDFGVLCQDFTAEYYNDGSEIKKLECTLHILRQGEKIRTQKINFGEALHYEGIDIFQNRIATAKQRAKINVTDKNGETHIYELENGDTLTLPGTQKVLRAASFKQNTLQLLSLSSPARRWISQTPVHFSEPELKDFSFSLAGFSATEITSLKVIKDPGKAMIWPSILCIIIGFFVIFFFSHQRLWIKVEPGEDSCLVTIAGVSNKNIESLRAICEHVKAELQKY